MRRHQRHGHSIDPSALPLSHSGARPAPRAFRALFLFGALAFCGCGPVQYLGAMSAASEACHRAERQGAERFAPYAYYSAQAHLEKAREEASEASYQDAVELARVAKQQADAALASVPASPPAAD